MSGRVVHARYIKLPTSSSKVTCHDAFCSISVERSRYRLARIGNFGEISVDANRDKSLSMYTCCNIDSIRFSMSHFIFVPRNKCVLSMSLYSNFSDNLLTIF